MHISNYMFLPRHNDLGEIAHSLFFDEHTGCPLGGLGTYATLASWTISNRHGPHWQKFDIPLLLKRLSAAAAGVCLTLSYLTATTTDTTAERCPNPASAAVAETGPVQLIKSHSAQLPNPATPILGKLKSPSSPSLNAARTPQDNASFLFAI